MTHRGASRSIAAAIFLCVLGPATTRADARADAQERVKQGLAQYEAGDFAAAAASLEKAYEVLADPRLLYNMARAYERAGNRASAVSNYERYLKEGTEPELQERSRQALERLREPKPAVTAPAPPAGTAPAASTTPAPPASTSAPPATAPQRPGGEDAPSYTLPTLLMIAGGAAVATGIGFGFWASSTASDARGTTDPVSKPELRDAAQTRAAVADVLLAAGVVALGTGVVLRLFVLPRRSAPSAAGARGSSAWVGAGLGGSFRL